MKVGPYDTWIFDCDGVLLDSNRLKSEAFRELALPFGVDVAQQFVDYHQRHGGISRFEKVRHLVRMILGRPASPALEEELTLRYGTLVVEGLSACAILPGVESLLAAIPAQSKRLVVSGGLEDEVRSVLQARLPGRLDGIFGSPRSKDAIFGDLRDAGALRRAVFFGDAAYDSQVAANFNVDFVFVYGATELLDWRERVNPERAVRWLSEVAAPTAPSHAPLQRFPPAETKEV